MQGVSNVIWRPLGFFTAPHHLISWSAQREGMWQADHKQPSPPLFSPSIRASTYVKVCYLFRCFYFNSSCTLTPMYTDMTTHIQTLSLSCFDYYYSKVTYVQFWSGTVAVRLVPRSSIEVLPLKSWLHVLFALVIMEHIHTIKQANKQWMN